MTAALAIIAAGVMDLIFALGFFFLVVRPREQREAAPGEGPVLLRPQRLIVFVLVATGIMTIGLGVAFWIFKPLESA